MKNMVLEHIIKNQVIFLIKIKFMFIVINQIILILMSTLVTLLFQKVQKKEKQKNY